MTTIGDKKKFGIEIDVLNNTYGFAKIWFNNNFLGTIEDEIPIKGYLIDGLEQILNSKKIDFNINDMNHVKVYSSLIKRLDNIDDNDIHEYLINLGTFCDDFTVFSFKTIDDTYVYWKLNSNPTEFNDLKRLSPKEVFNFKIKTRIFNKLFYKYKSEIMKCLEKENNTNT